MKLLPIRNRVVWLLCMLPAILRAQTDFPGVDDRWRHYQSANFELYSRNSEGMSRELLHDLETLRAFFLESLKLTERRRLEVTVYYFRTDRDFRPYLQEVFRKNEGISGFYGSGVDRAVICLVPSGDSNVNRHLIFHEYIHHLFRASELNPPSWLNEGMAELFATLAPTADGKKMEFGHPMAARLAAAQTQKLMPLEQLFAVEPGSAVFRNDGHSGIFYSQSWALRHYLYFGESKIPADKRNLFVNVALAPRFKDPAALREAFKEVFGMDYPEMQKRLDRYLRSGRYYSGKIPLPAVPAARTYSARAVSRDEIQLRLAELALRTNQSPAAKLALLHAADRDPADTRPLEVLGAEALREQDPLTATERWAKAVAAGTRNPAIYRELGLMEGRAGFSRLDPYYRMPADRASRLRGYLMRSIEYNPEQTLAYEMLAWVEAFSPDPSIPNLSLIQKKYAGFTRKERTALALAFVRVRLNLPDEALEMLAALETMQLDEWEKQGVETVRAHIENRPVKGARPPTTSAAEAARMQVAPPRVKPGN
jgi:hypothetical protein